MGKRKDTSTEEEAILDGDLLPLPVKKHKKHKHKKHKRKKSDTDIEGKSILKMAILTPTEDDIDSISTSTSQPKPTLSSSPSKGSSKKKKKGKESATSSEEERWLDAIESGKLEEVDDELKKIKPKDPKLMTARQRAMLERKDPKTTDKDPSSSGEQLLALPTGYREKVMTPEMVLKAALKSQKRKQQADEKREKDKKKTMERLLRKQESKPAKMSGKSRTVKRQVPSVTLYNSLHGITINLPPDVEFPLLPSRSKGPPPLKLCGVMGCSNPKRYACSKTGLPLCSLECYQKNINCSRST